MKNLSKKWFFSMMKSLEGVFSAVFMSRCYILDADFLFCSSCLYSWMLIFLKSDLKLTISDLFRSWCIYFQTFQSLNSNDYWPHMGEMRTWSDLNQYMDIFQVRFGGYLGTTSCTYAWGSKPILDSVPLFETLGERLAKVFISLLGYIKII